MNRADKRRQQKLAQKAGPGLNAPTVQHALNAAIQHHSAGRLAEAEGLYRQILQVEPRQPDVLYHLGLIAQQMGHPQDAVNLIGEAIRINPKNPAAHNILGNALKALGQLDQAVDSYRQALKIKPDFVEAHYNLGNALAMSGQRDQAANSYRKAIRLNPNVAQAHGNLGNVLIELGQLDDAVASFQKAIECQPDYIDAHRNLAKALEYQGRFDDAAEVLGTALKAAPDNGPLNDALVDLLNYHTPTRSGPHSDAQTDLQAIALPDSLSDESVKAMYQNCEGVLKTHDLACDVSASQLWRGVIEDQGCDRHMKVFNTFNAIPEYCFGCYKVVVGVGTVVDLIKLALVFDGLDLPHDNARKCHVELRPDVSGFYKGLVYCKGRDDADKVEEIVAAALKDVLPDTVTVAVKRGCSEFPLAYPDYADISGGAPKMTYPEDWRQHETYVDEHLVGHSYPSAFTSHSHDGLTLRDALVLQNWLAYAATVGDDCYKVLTKGPVEKLQMAERPGFKS